MFNQKKFESQLKDIYDEFKDKTTNEPISYIIGLIFYKKLCNNFSEYIVDFFNDFNKDNDDYKIHSTYGELWENEDTETIDVLRYSSLEELGYFIEEPYLFKNLIKNYSSEDSIINKLKKGMDLEINQDAEDHFKNIFNKQIFDSSFFGCNANELDNLMYRILKKIDKLDFNNESEDFLYDSYSYLVNLKDNPNFEYTPKEVSKLMAKLVSFGKDNVEVYDPTCGSASTLLALKYEIPSINKYYGEELNTNRYNLARMNMIFHKIAYDCFDIEHRDVLEKPRDDDCRFDIIVSHIPFNGRWNKEELKDDERFNSIPLPKSDIADYIYIQHMLYYLKDNGIMAVLLPSSIFQRQPEEDIRKYLLYSKNVIDVVIQLPEKLSEKLDKSVLAIFKKNRDKDDDILLIDASNDPKTEGKWNTITDESINHILRVYKKREEEEGYSKLISLKDAEENKFRLYVPYYIQSKTDNPLIDIMEICTELEEISKDIIDNDNEIKMYCDKLGIEPPICRWLNE